ncbi:hypothetical protein CEXT_708861 [Caerostris extrusa]|uniref:Uncharacterized protein n=1 Tax=Caerostris extrusa TaxID=172846 RepID=A0AAV4VLC1_CAEEX|nr:hypothetical protein CEXT_708861 [Caerostris extrusa]
MAGVKNDHLPPFISLRQGVFTLTGTAVVWLAPDKSPPQLLSQNCPHGTISEREMLRAHLCCVSPEYTRFPAVGFSVILMSQAHCLTCVCPAPRPARPSVT